MYRSPRPSWFQHDFDAAVFLVAEGLVEIGRIVQRTAVGDDEGWIDGALFDLFEQRLDVTLNVSLTGLDRESLIHGLAERELVDHTHIDAGHGDGAAFATAINRL